MKNENERCGSCTFWYALPSDPMNLGAPKVGVCRARPPVPLIVGGNRQGLQIQAQQPTLLENTPCCGDYEARLELTIAN